MVAAILLSGCSDNEGGEAIDVGGTTVLVAEPADGGNDALLKNRLEIIGGCLGIHPYVVIWPNGTTVVEEDPLTVDVPAYGRFTLGDTVGVGGSTAVGAAEEDGRDLEDYKVAGVTVPAECTATGVWLANPSP